MTHPSPAKPEMAQHPPSSEGRAAKSKESQSDVGHGQITSHSRRGAVNGAPDLALADFSRIKRGRRPQATASRETGCDETPNRRAAMARCRKGKSGGARRLLQRRRDPLRLHHQLCNPTRHWITSFRLLETDSSLAQVCPSRQRHRRRNTLALAFCCGRVTDGLPPTRGSIIELDAFSLNPRTAARKTRGRRPCP